MTQNAPEQPSAYSQEEVKAAESAEQAALSKSQNTYLTQRVVVLRAQLNRAEQERDEAKRELLELQLRLPQEEEPDSTPESDPENSPEG